jgi:hypothetical protein
MARIHIEDVVRQMKENMSARNVVSSQSGGSQRKGRSSACTAEISLRLFSYLRLLAATRRDASDAHYFGGADATHRHNSCAKRLFRPVVALDHGAERSEGPSAMNP